MHTHLRDAGNTQLAGPRLGVRDAERFVMGSRVRDQITMSTPYNPTVRRGLFPVPTVAKHIVLGTSKTGS